MAIKNFSWNYVGWVNLENVGFEGTPIDDRFHSNEYLATPFVHLEEMAKLMDGLGYDALFTTEHHFQPEGIESIPNPLMACVHLASITSNLRFGCDFCILPQWHPIRLAEDFAAADILTRGRVMFGIGRGSQTRELETFGAPMLDQYANRDLFEEQVEILMKALHEDSFSHRGKNYTIPPAVPYRTTVLEEISVVPRPVYSTEMWQGVTSGRPRGVEFMAKHGIKGIFFPALAHAEDEYCAPAIYQRASAAHGRELEFGEDLAPYVFCHIADSPKEAAREVELFEQESFKRIAGIGGGPSDALIRENMWRDPTRYKGFTLEQLQRVGDPRTAEAQARELGYTSLEERYEADRGQFVFGSPDDVINQLKELEELYPGIDTVILHPPELTHTPIMLEQMERFAKEVMPAFPEAIHKDREWPDKLTDEASVSKYNRRYHRGPELSETQTAVS